MLPAGTAMLTSRTAHRPLNRRLTPDMAMTGSAPSGDMVTRAAECKPRAARESGRNGQRDQSIEVEIVPSTRRISPR